VTSLLYPAFAEYEGSGEKDRQRRLLLAGLRGGSAAALVLALPLLIIPENLVTAWVGDAYAASAPVLALLAVVILVHQPVWMLTQYLIALGRQREIARLLIVAAVGNVVLSIALAFTVGTWGVALATLLADVAALAVAIPLSVAPAAGVRVGELVRALLRPALPAFGVAVVVFGFARTVDADTLLQLLPIGIAWLVLASAAVWRFGLTPEERRSFARQVGVGGGAPLLTEP
jgi:O-antigen/teichoic acid export membrane protein